MDFFQAQDNARVRTRTLILLFLAAVVAINLAVYALVYFIMRENGVEVTGLTPGIGLSPNQQLFLLVTGVTTALISVGSLVRTAQLKHGGGARVAELLGGERLTLRGADRAERRLINVVEEMAIASGMPVPAIYVLDDKGINAFAAGHSTSDAVVTVTRGAINTLNRDQLQGVVAHEFSHILNGDMRLNIRLIGVLYGILLLAIIGRGILRGSNRRSGRKKGGGQVALLGIGLLLIGYIGVFFGRLIQAATSRQREYLADASAVQFTRNPAGMAGALARVKSVGSLIEDHHAQEASHLFFAAGVKASFTSLLATHPPLLERIHRIDPAFDPDAMPAVQEDTGEDAAGNDPGSAAAADAGVSQFHASMTGAALMASVGSAPLPAHVAYAAQLLRSLPASVTEAAHEPDGATALLFALLLHDGPHAAAQRDAIVAHGGEELAARVTALAKDLATLNADAIARETQPAASHRMSLLDLLQPALQQVAPDQRPRIEQTTRALVFADQRTDVFEFAVLHLIGQRLKSAKSAKSAPAAKPSTPAAPPTGPTPPTTPAPPKPALPKASVRDDFQSVLSAVAWAGTGDAATAARALGAGLASLPRNLDGITLQPRDAVSFDKLDAALSRLRVTNPGMRRTLLEACVHGVAAADGRVHAEEAELLRAIAEAVDCPMPPMIVSAGEPVARVA